MEIFSTACPRNCYSTCSFLVHVENGKIVNFEPHPDNLATPEGICLKGLSYKERVYSPDRILYPLKRNLYGQFDQISWEEALDHISEKLKFFHQEFGPQSVLFYESSGMSGLLNEISTLFWKNFGGATTTYGNLCWPAGLEAVRLTLGENKHNVPWDLENARLIIMWGKNAIDTNVQESIPLENALIKGAKLIVIDPRRTSTAEKAELLLQPKPGTDACLALGIAKILIKDNLVDKKFIEKYVLGFEEFKASIQKYTEDFVEKETGIPSKYLNLLANYIATIKPMTILPGYGMQRYTNGGQTVRAILSLQVLTGNIGKPGACFHYANLQSYVFDSTLEPESYYPPDKPDGLFRRTISKARLGNTMLEQSDPELKMIWVERGNPLTQNPDTNTIIKAFRKLDFRVVVEQFMTDTALEADIILPAKSMFEQSDIIGSYWNPYVQLKQKVIDPPGEVKPETEIYRLLAQKLNFPAEIINSDFPESTNNGIDSWLMNKLKKFPDLSLEKLKKGPIMAPGIQEIAFSDCKFNTPSGKIELLSDEAVVKWGVNMLPDYNETDERLNEGVDQTGSENQFYFLSPNTRNRIHSQFGNLKVIKQFEPEPLLDINPEDASILGIANGELVKVYNSQGELRIRSSFNYGIRRRCVSLPNGWWKSEGGGGNLLSAQRETDMGHGTAFHDNLVFIEKLLNE